MFFRDLSLYKTTQIAPKVKTYKMVLSLDNGKFNEKDYFDYQKENSMYLFKDTQKVYHVVVTDKNHFLYKYTSAKKLMEHLKSTGSYVEFTSSDKTDLANQLFNYSEKTVVDNIQ